MRRSKLTRAQLSQQLLAAEQRAAEEKQQRLTAEQQATEVKKEIQGITLLEYLELCHEHFIKDIKFETDKSKPTKGDVCG